MYPIDHWRSRSIGDSLAAPLPPVSQSTPFCPKFAVAVPYPWKPKKEGPAHWAPSLKHSVGCDSYLRFTIQPIKIPTATPAVNVAATVSIGCRWRRLVVSSRNSSAASPLCFAARLAASTPSSNAPATADVARDALRAVSVICSPVRSNTDSVILYFPFLSPSSLLTRLCPDGLLDLAYPVLSFAGILFSSAFSFDVWVADKLPDLLFHCSFGFVQLACCFIFRARFHIAFLLCSIVSVNWHLSLEDHRSSHYATLLSPVVWTCTSSSNSER